MGAGGNGNNQWEWEGNENKTWLNLGLGMRMGMNHWEWEGMGWKKTLPLISTVNECGRISYNSVRISVDVTGYRVAPQRRRAVLAHHSTKRCFVQPPSKRV